MNKQIKTALISVYHKEGLEPIVKKLNELKVKIYSTGGTYEFIKNLGIPVVSIESLTSYPSILGGRVKTLHPKVFGGILARRDVTEDIEQMKQYEIPEIDLIIVDLYPFEKTVASTKDEEEIIEKIDIGGISLIRAGAKNFKDVVVIPSQNEYKFLMKILNENNGTTSMADRRFLATQAFNISSHYDTAIFNYFNRDKQIQVLKHSINISKQLRYGENPHQKGTFYGNLAELIEQIHGKELSYNNLLDIDSAVNLISEFGETTFAIIKHNNACGVASRETVLQSWVEALAGDPVSAFGGVLISNKEIDTPSAKEIDKIFFEVIIAPSYTDEALNILKQKKNRIILIYTPPRQGEPKKQVRTVLNGILEQDRDYKTATIADMQVVTKKQPTVQEKIDLEFANKLVKHTRSNAIVLAKNKQLLGSGMGQTSRIDALKHAIAKAKAFNFDLKGVVMASDAFFPFADCVELAYNEGITAVIQPGGSIRDKDSIEFCDKNNISMVFTGTRHFRH